MPICVPVAARTVPEAIAEIKKAEVLSDLVEIRLDYIDGLKEDSLKEIMTSSYKLIATCRPKKEGGYFSGSEEERIRILKKAISYHPVYLDIEFSSGEEVVRDIVKHRGTSRVICSYHNFKKTPKLWELQTLYMRIATLRPYAIKIAAYANSVNDNFTMFEMIRSARFHIIAMCMGEKGAISRILANKYGSFITYAALEKGKDTAPGQLTLDELKSYNFRYINRDTRVLGVIGSNADTSLSRFMHNASFKKDRLNYVYLPFSVESEELVAFIENFRKFGFFGASVTIPHKVDVIPLLNEIEKSAERIGAVNTIVKKKSGFSGYNTDYIGAIAALKKHTAVEGKKALVLGAGGAARAVCYGLKLSGAELAISNRTIKNGEDLAKEIGCRFLSHEKMYSYEPDIIINTTSVGMGTDESLVKKEFLKGKAVFDIVYKPRMTRLLNDAKEMGSTIIEGYEMLLYQGIAQYKLWTGKDADESVMRKALLENLG